MRLCFCLTFFVLTFGSRTLAPVQASSGKLDNVVTEESCSDTDLVDAKIDFEERESGCGCSSLSRDQIGEERPTEAFSEVKSKSAVYLELERAHENGMLGEYITSELLEIPGGEFIMGTNDPAIPMDGEMPARTVEISPFLMQKYEVSNRQFAQFVLETGFITESEHFNWSFCFHKTLSEETNAKVTSAVASVPWWLPVEGADWLHPNGPDSDIFTMNYLNHPVVHVSHNDARAYCEWLGLRLPTEAEFERASGGGQPVGTLFPWGDKLTPNGKHRANLWQGNFPNENTGEDGYLWSAPVNSFGEQNQYGLYNIIGNVWEWVADAWIVRHSNATVLQDPQFEIKGRVEDRTVDRTKKGGSYMCHISYCYRYRVVSRSYNSADSSAQNLGIRCASSLPDSDK